MSTLIGTGKLTLIDLPPTERSSQQPPSLSYRGDTDEAWDRAARFAAEDVLAHCLP